MLNVLNTHAKTKKKQTKKRGHRKLLEAIDMSITFIVVSWVHETHMGAYGQTHQIVYINHV